MVHMVDALIYAAKHKVNAFQDAWIDRGLEFAANSMPTAARHAATLVIESYGVLGGLDDLLAQDKKLYKKWDKLKEKKHKIYA
jgi:hypothetical protein